MQISKKYFELKSHGHPAGWRTSYEYFYDFTNSACPDQSCNRLQVYNFKIESRLDLQKGCSKG